MLFGRNLAEILVARRADERQMAMALDHARHQGHAAAVDDLDAVAANLPLTARDRGDAVMFDQHLGRIALVVLAIPDLRVHNQIGHRVHPPFCGRAETFYAVMIGEWRALSPTLFGAVALQKPHRLAAPEA